MTNSANEIERLEDQLKKLSISLAEFARKVGVSTQTYNGWKKRGSIPKAHIFNAAIVAECDPSWLATGTEPDLATEFVSGEFPFDFELYESVLQNIVQTMQEIGLELDMMKVARIAYICYNHKVRDKPATKQDVVNYLRLAS